MNGEGTVILGAGLAGLGCARLLPGATLYEAKDRVGGHAYSHTSGGFAFDEGAHICHSKDQAYLDLIYQSAGEVNQIRSSRVLNRRQGAWLTYPVHNNLHELPPAERIKALVDFVGAQIASAKVEPRNYLEWCRAQYGEYLTREFYTAYTAKYWRVPMEELGTDWLAGRLLPSQIERVIAGSVQPDQSSQAVFAQFHYPAQGGYYRFYSGLYGGLDVRCQQRAVRVDWRKGVVTFASGAQADYRALASSIPLPTLIEILADAPDAVRAAAAKLRHTQMLCVNVVVSRPNLTDAHWFYIYDTDIQASRVGVASNLGREPAAQSATALQAEIFRRSDEELPVEQLVEQTLNQLSACLNFSRSEVSSVVPVPVPYAYVISDVDRAAAASFLIQWLKEQRIYTMGLFGRWKYIWSDAALRDGEATAREILAL